MGFYNVVKPCVVNDLHYVRPHAEPIEVDDETAAELVEAGCLTPYGSRKPLEWLEGAVSSDDAPRDLADGEPHSEGAVQVVAPEPAQRPRARRNRAAED